MDFTIKIEFTDHLAELPPGICERLMTLRLNLSKNQQATIISVYTPTLTTDENQKEDFYVKLSETLSLILRSNKLIISGDHNTRVSTVSDLWKGVIDKEGVEKMNSNGLRLLTRCSEYDLHHEYTISTEE